MKYEKITIDTTVEAIDMVSYTLSELGVCGIELDDKIPLTEEEKQAMYIDILPEQEKEYDGLATVTCYIPVNEDGSLSLDIPEAEKKNLPELVEEIRVKILEFSDFLDVGECKITVEGTDDSNWLYNWKKFFKPFKLEDNIVIKPSWEELSDVKDDDIVLDIDPGIAFGTGSHETTKLCIKALKEYLKPGAAILDLGCGSGILAMLSIKLGAGHALGIDIDELAVRVSKENAALNDMTSDIISFREGDVLSDQGFVESITEKYDIVLANILADVIIPLSAVAGQFLKPDGVFITSGIINTKEDEVRETLLEKGFEIIETNYMADWVSFVARIA
ncbi:MAG: 50S ribosomal protein L11 methyltransferase [Lachnospiraceae bacterium]|nr:50S ribosomal protein L11 methyltransferase [Lachnospiraceae bacterium]